MGLLDKLKKTFFEEELVEVEEDEKVAKKVETKEAKKKEVKKDEIKTSADEIKARTKLSDEEIESLDEIADMLEEDENLEQEMTISDRDLVNKSSKIAYFNDDDFTPEKVEVKEKKEEPPKKIYGGDYTNVYDVREERVEKTVYNKPYGADNNKGFHPTPIISPIYGVLDKNYRKEEVRDKKDRPSSYVSRKDADFDTVMEKAYGDRNYYEEDIPSYDDIIQNANLDEDFEAKEPLLYDMMVDDTKPVVDQVSIQDAEDYFNDLGLEYNVDYKDGVYEKASGRRVENHNYEEEDDVEDSSKTEEIIINRNLVKDDDEKEEKDLLEVANEVVDDDESKLLEDNLFDLVDSMYEGGEE